MKNRQTVHRADGVRITWTYDNTNQLLVEHRTGLNTLRHTYTYDAAGNRTRLRTSATAITTSVYNAANQVATTQDASGVTTYTYDGTGNELILQPATGNRTTNTWTYENRLALTVQPNGTRITQTWAPVTRDGDEYRVVQQAFSVYFKHFWDRNNIVLETNNPGSVTAEFTVVPQDYGEVVSEWRNTTGSRWFHFDALGSTSALTDGSEATVWTSQYSAFGVVLGAGGAGTNPFQWVGKYGYYRDGGANLYYVRRRDYRPGTGRWISMDPIGFGGGDYNLYRYVRNRVVVLVDPSGQQQRAPLWIPDLGPWTPAPEQFPIYDPQPPCEPSGWESILPWIRRCGSFAPLFMEGMLLNPTQTGGLADESPDAMRKRLMREENCPETCQERYPHYLPSPFPNKRFSTLLREWLADEAVAHGLRHAYYPIDCEQVFGLGVGVNIALRNCPPGTPGKQYHCKVLVIPSDGSLPRRVEFPNPAKPGTSYKLEVSAQCCACCYPRRTGFYCFNPHWTTDTKQRWGEYPLNKWWLPELPNFWPA